MKKLVLVNNATKDKKEVKEGYSFATLFLNALVPLIRRDITGFLVMGGYALLAYIFRRDMGVLPYGLFGVIFFPLFYNKFYIWELLNEGYEVAEVDTRDKSQSHMAA